MTTTTDMTQHDREIEIHFFNDLAPDKIALESFEKKQHGLRRIIKTALTPSSSIKGLIIRGSHGIGKTYSCQQELTQGVMRHTTSKGNISPLALYHHLMANNDLDQVAVFDDCDAVFANARAMNILKGAADKATNYEVSWINNREVLKFEFKGKIVILTNADMKHQGNHYQALLDRYIFVDYYLTFEEIIAQGWNNCNQQIEAGKEPRWVREAYLWFCKQPKDHNLTFRRLEQAISVALDFEEEWLTMASMMLG